MQRRWLMGLLGLLAFTCDNAASPPDDVVGACRRLAECSRGFEEPERECRDRFEAEYEEAASYGCGSAYADAVSCLATTRGSRCPPPLAPDDSDGSSAEPEPYVDPCETVERAFSDCQGRMQRDECVVLGFGGAGGCNISCALFSGECAAPSGTSPTSSCRCEAGDKVGATFTGACGTNELETFARDACQ